MINFKHILVVLVGSGTGGVLRYLVTLSLQDKITGKYPYSTFLVNVLGSVIIGMVIAAIGKQSEESASLKLLLATGFCGGFTTFSAFALENVELIRTGNYSTALTYILCSILAGILGTFAGIMMLRQ